MYYRDANGRVYTGLRRGDDPEMTQAEFDAWQAEIAPVPRYGKLGIIRALKAAGVWTSVKTAIAAADALDEFEAAQELSADDPLFRQMLSLLETAFPDLDAAELLKECELE